MESGRESGKELVRERRQEGRKKRRKEVRKERGSGWKKGRWEGTRCESSIAFL